ncbi:MAG: leucine-rich repeat domain-containing protein, partial [Candidatus Methanomethylophilaceae archaeon]|nr:leucine-rich repeat domain-containing protein [Candidatus Methanomethylophilaceae archaeon]
MTVIECPVERMRSKGEMSLEEEKRRKSFRCLALAVAVLMSLVAAVAVLDSSETEGAYVPEWDEWSVSYRIDGDTMYLSPDRSDTDTSPIIDFLAQYRDNTPSFYPGQGFSNITEYRPFWETDRYLNNIKHVVICDGITSIGANTFWNNTKLESVTISDTVKKIGPGAFDNCTSLKEVIIGGSVKTIGGNCFHNCTSLEYIELGKSVTKVGINAFDGCTKLKTVVLSPSIKEIHTDAFLNCTSLESVFYINDEWDSSILIGNVDEQTAEGSIFSGCGNVMVCSPNNCAKDKFSHDSNVSYEISGGTEENWAWEIRSDT